MKKGRPSAIDDLILTTPSDQVVFLGAGYDTRPVRLCARLRESVVFEVDHPDTARRKTMLANSVFAGAEIAPTLPVTIDFASESIEERLVDAGLDTAASTIWVWEGVSMYLPEEAVRGALGLFARLSGPGSIAVCDVLSDPRRTGLLGSAQRQVLDVAMGWIYSEPFLWACSPDQITGFFASCGLSVLEDLGLDELVSRYAQRDAGWWEAAPSLRLVISGPGGFLE